MESGQAAEVPAVGKLTATTQLAFLVLLVGSVVFLWFAPGSYQVYKALHVLAAVIWVGGDVTLTTLGIVFERRGDGPTLAALGKMGTWVGTRDLHACAVRRADLRDRRDGEGQLRLVGRVLDRLRAGRLARGGAASASASSARSSGGSTRRRRSSGRCRTRSARRVKRLFMIFRFDTALLILIVIDMVAKPSF